MWNTLKRHICIWSQHKTIRWEKQR